MAYLLIYDLDGQSNARRKISRYLERNAQMVQHSVWRFRDFTTLNYAAKRVRAAGGKVLAFSESDRILLTLREIKQFLQSIN